MKNAKYLGIVAVIGLGILSASVFADDSSGTTINSPKGSGSYSNYRQRPHRQWQGSESGAINTFSGSYQRPSRSQRTNSGAMANFEANITRTVTNTASGVQITEITSDSGTLAFLQNTYTKGQNQAQLPNSTITITRTMLSNGLQTTISSTDATTIAKIQAQAANSKEAFGVGLGYFNKGKGNGGQNTGTGYTQGQGGFGGQGPMMRGNQQPKSSILPASISTLIDTKLATFSNNTDKINWINVVNSRIDAASAKITAQKSKDILSALKDLLNQKIDEMNGNSVDSNLLNSLFQ